MIFFITESDYCGIHQRRSVEESLDALSSMDIIGLDTETTGLDPHKERILSLQLGNATDQYVIDCTTVDIEKYRSILEDKHKLFVLWNAKFDVQFLMNHRIVPYHVWDGFVVEGLMHLGLPQRGLSLKKAAMDYLGVEMDKTVRGQIIYKGLDDDVIAYAAKDVEHLERIMDLQKAKLAKLGLSKAVEYENKFVLPLAYMEYCGIRVDVDRWKAKMEKDHKELDTALAECNMWLIDHFREGDSISVDCGPMKIPAKQAELMDPSEYVKHVPECYGAKPIYYSKTRRVIKTIPLISTTYSGDLFGQMNESKPTGIDWNSPQQVQALFKKLGIEVDDGVDAKLLAKHANDCSLIPLYLKYKKAAKVTSTYGQNFLDQINPDTGRICTSYYQFGTKTGRISSGSREDDDKKKEKNKDGKNKKDKKVNLLNLPRDAETRACFVSAPGNRFISIDYSGQESFIMADITGDEAMLHELNEGEGDMHTLAAKMLYDQIPKDMKASEVKKKFHEERQRAKSLEFAVFYGSQGKAIATNLNLPDEEAIALYNKFMEGFKGLKEYQEFRRKDWFKKGYILINKKTGHKAFIDNIGELRDCAKEFSGNAFWNHYREIKNNWQDPTVQRVKKYFKRRSGIERNSINYPVQGCGALCMKTAMVNFFAWLRKKDLLFKVLLCVMPYDECCFEAPDEVADECALKMKECMVKSGAYFVTKCKLDADISYDKDGKLPNYWIH